MTKIYNIQAMRAVAALLVLSIHALAMPADIGLGWLGAYVWKFGPAGVDIFFVISGFIIVSVASAAGQRAETNLAIATDFIVKRAARIYPVYWAVFLVALAVSPYVFLSPDSVPRYPWWQLFLLMEPGNSFIMAAWTLSYELFFYSVIFVILLIAPRHVYQGVLIWGLATMIAVLYLTSTSSPLTNTVALSPQLIEFMLGAAVAFVASRGTNAYPVAAILAGVALFYAGTELNPILGDYQPWARTISFGPASALIIYGMVGIETRYKWVASKIWLKLGDASYSIYIWHQVVMYTIFRGLQASGVFNSIPPAFFVPLWVAAVLVVGFASFKHLESRANKLGRRDWSNAVAPLPHIIAIATLLIAGTGIYLNTRHITVRHAEAIAANTVPDDAISLPLPLDPTLPTVQQINLGSNTTPAKLMFRVNTLASGGLYVGYTGQAGEHSGWHNFQPGQPLVSVELPGGVVDNRVWILFDTARPATSITEVWILPHP